MEAVLIDSLGNPLPLNEVLLGLISAVADVADALVSVGHVDLDDLHGAVQEDRGGIGGLNSQVAPGTVEASDEHVLRVALRQLDTDHVAELIQEDVVLPVGQQGLIIVVQGGGVIVTALSLLVLGAAGGNLAGDLVLLGRELADLGILQNLGLPDADDVAVGVVLVADLHQVELVFLHIGDLGDILNVNIPVAVGVAALAGPNVHGDSLFVLVVVRGSLAHPGVDGGDDDLLADLLVDEDLGQNAAAREAGVILVAALQHAVGLGDVALARVGGRNDIQHVVGQVAPGHRLHAVDIVGQIHVLVLQDGGADHVVQLTAGHGIVVLGDHQLPVNIGADLFLVIDPGVSGTLELILANLLLQLVEVLLSKLHQAVVADVVVLGGLRTPGPGLRAAGGQDDLLAVDNGGHALAILNQVGLDGAERVQAGLLTAHGLQAVELAFQTLRQLDAQSLLRNVDGPVVANIAFQVGMHT